MMLFQQKLSILLVVGLGLGGAVSSCADDKIAAYTGGKNKKNTNSKTDSQVALLTGKHDECASDGKVWLPSDAAALRLGDDDDDDSSSSSGSSGSSGSTSGSASSEASKAKKVGTAAGVCGSPLVTWCCSLDQVKARFPGVPEQLDAKFKPNLDDGYQIYSCSEEGKDKIKVHLLKRQEGNMEYVDVSISGLVESGGSAAACKIDFEAILEGKSGAAAPAEAVDEAFAVANEALTANCNGNGCHGPNAKTYPKYVGNAANVKAQKDEILKRITSDDDPMPPGGGLDAADKKVLVDYLKGL